MQGDIAIHYEICKFLVRIFKLKHSRLYSITVHWQPLEFAREHPHRHGNRGAMIVDGLPVHSIPHPPTIPSSSLKSRGLVAWLWLLRIAG